MFVLLAEQVAAGIATGAVYALLALGYNLVYGVLGIFTFAHGSVAMVATYAALLVLISLFESYWLACVIGIALAGLVGVLLERVVIRPLKGNPWTIAVATFGASVFIDNFVTWLATPVGRAFPRPFTVQYFPVVGQAEISNLQAVLVAISVIVVSAMAYFVRYTAMGKAIRVVAQSPSIARCVGIDIRRVTVLTFFIASALGGAAALIHVSAFGTTFPFIGNALGLKAIVVLIVAGLGNMVGCLVVGLVLGILEALTVGFGLPGYRDFVAYAGLVAIILIRPSGLFGEQGRTEGAG